MYFNAGDAFRHYRVLERIGEGGMGVVYRARDTRLDRDVALKFLLPAARANPQARDRFVREAKSLAAMNHPNIVTIHDIEEADDVTCLVLEWVSGQPLHRVPRPLPVGDFLRIASAVADALGAAHDRGLVHCDIKPGNVLLTDEGQTKLVDFGLARFHDPALEVTRTSGIAGTVAYMSPEQTNGAELGPASDIFSFGVMAYELLTGRRPFEGEGPGAVLAAIVARQPTPIGEIRSDLPERLGAIVGRCLEKEPQARFQSARDLARELRQVLTAPAAGDGGFATLSSGAAPRRKGFEQDIRFCTTADGVRLAYSVVGSGPVLVRVLGYFTHLEMEWQWPELRLFWEHLAERFTVVRYDGRGIGLSDPFTGAFTEATRRIDLDAVLDAAHAEHAVLLGISEGGWTAAAYAIDRPDRITHLVLYGAYCRGARARPGYDEAEDQALLTLIRKGWARDTPMFRHLFTSKFFASDADPRLIAHFNEMQRTSADAETAARYQESIHQRGDGESLYRKVTAPTLVMHCRDDLAVSAEEGRLLASVIPGARLVLLPSGTHYFPVDTEVALKAADAIQRFVQAVKA